MSTEQAGAPAVVARGISKQFTTVRAGERKTIHALREVDLVLHRGEAAALIGESGCGKTTLGRILAGLETATGGTLELGGVDVTKLRGGALRQAHRRVQLVHQDPYSALNPAATIGETLVPPLELQAGIKGLKGAEKSQWISTRMVELLELVGLDPASVYDKYPHKLSGGQRQRVCIARALIPEPDVLVADEAVSMIDVSLRLGILDVFKRLREDLGVALLFITHDIATARYVGPNGQVHVIYRGRVVESGQTDEIIQRPVHPYTQCLLSAIPVMRGVEVDGPDRLMPTAGPEVSQPIDGAADCAFWRRCPMVQDACRAQVPPFVPVEGAGGVADGFAVAHQHRCFFPEVRKVIPQPAPEVA